MKKGLVLEGGGMRGIFSVGVTDVLMENDIWFDGIVGVSAGACFGCNIKSRQPGRAIRYNLKYCDDPRFSGLSTLRKTGDLFSEDFCYGEVPLVLDPFDFDTFRATPEAFYVVATNVRTAKAVYHRCDKDDDATLLDWIRASASMPLVSNDVVIDGRSYLDGGIVESIPLAFMEKEGYTKNLVILTQPAGYVKGKNKALPLLKIKERERPRLLAALKNRHHVYNDGLRYVEARKKSGDAFVIRPAYPLPSGRVEHDRDRMRATYEAGRNAAKAHLKQLKDYLAR